MLTGADVMALTSSLVVGVKAPLECWPIAVDRVRYVGEPVAIVVASDRYRAEDAVDLIEMRYRPLPAVVDPVAAATADSPLLHPAINSNVVGERTFRYGDPERAFAEAAHRVRVDVRYPRNSCTPIETYGIVAEYDAGDDAYDVLANFQRPFSLHPVMARALKVPGNRSLLHRSDNRWSETVCSEQQSLDALPIPAPTSRPYRSCVGRRSQGRRFLRGISCRAWQDKSRA